MAFIIFIFNFIPSSVRIQTATLNGRQHDKYTVKYTRYIY